VSEEVVKEVKMAPYFNGAEAGEFENKQEGKTMLIYVKDNNPPEVEDDPVAGGDEPTGDPTDDGEKTGLDTQMIIIIAAAAAAVVIAVVVIVIVASAKKKKKAAAEAPAAEAVEETTEEKTEE